MNVGRKILFVSLFVGIALTFLTGLVQSGGMFTSGGASATYYGWPMPWLSYGGGGPPSVSGAYTYAFSFQYFGLGIDIVLYFAIVGAVLSTWFRLKHVKIIF